MLKIIIPLAGSSELFERAGYHYPKPLIEICGKPMIQWVIERANLIPVEHQFIFIIKESDALKFHLDNTLKLLAPTCQVIKLKKDTQGALCSVLMSADLIDNDDSILILNSDQIIDVNLPEITLSWKKLNSDVGILIFESVHPRWSYVLIDGNTVLQTAEKNPISKNAIAGYYYFASASAFFKYSFKTILHDTQVNSFFYISSVINEYILDNNKVSFHKIEKENYHSFYSPKLVQEFENKVYEKRD